jgi:dihydrofolate reductase
MARARVFIACSLDGFIAGEGDDLSWLTGPGSVDDRSEGDAPAEKPEFGYTAFFAQIGAMLMGRNTYRVVEGFDGWPYEDRPVLVATTKPLTPKAPTVRAVKGTIGELVAEAKAAAGERDVYLDGGDIIRQALDAGLVDELVVSLIPTVIGRGAPLFAGVAQRHRFRIVSVQHFTAGMVQLTMRPKA